MALALEDFELRDLVNALQVMQPCSEDAMEHANQVVDFQHVLGNCARFLKLTHEHLVYNKCTLTEFLILLN